MPTIKEVLATNPLTILFDPPWSKEHIYRVTIIYQERRETFLFHAGIDWLEMPTIEQVLRALLADTRLFQQAADYEDWCHRFSFDPAEPERLYDYHLVAKEVAQLKALFGDDFDLFVYAD